MDPITIPRGDFWEFKARCAELDLEMVKARTLWEALSARRQGLCDAFAKTHGLDPSQPLTLDDETLTVRQDS